MADFEFLWPGGPLFAQATHFRLSTDSVLLADFVPIRGKKRMLDLGCASGILPLLLLSKAPGLTAEGIELQEEAAQLASENLRINGFSDRGKILCGDLRDHRRLFSAGSFDIVTANPPYFPMGSGFISPDAGRASARSELTCTLDDLCTAASFLLKTGGRFFLVHKPERLSELCCSLSRHGLEPKRLRFVSKQAGLAPSLLLLEAARGGSPGLRIEAPLLLQKSDGSESDEYKRIYHRI